MASAFVQFFEIISPLIKSSSGLEKTTTLKSLLKWGTVSSNAYLSYAIKTILDIAYDTFKDPDQDGIALSLEKLGLI